MSDQPEQITLDPVRQGSRWLYAQPSEEDVRLWFHSQSLHDDMEHDPYMGGIVLIGAKEKVNVTLRNASGATFVREEERAVFVPYVKVDTRIAYFWDLVRTMNEAADDDKYVGVIEPVPVRRVDRETSPFFNAHMPDGFFIHVAKNGNQETFNRYLCSTARVAIYERQSYARALNGAKELPVLQGTGTKQTPLAKHYADDNAMMKAETGAIGRALGVAGVLVVGTGIATAEDMQEAAQGDVGAAGATRGGPGAASLPDDGPGVTAPSGGDPGANAPTAPQDVDAALRERALAIQQELERDHPEAWEATRAWWQERQFGPLSELTGPALRGAVTKIERDLDAAKQAAAA